MRIPKQTQPVTREQIDAAKRPDLFSYLSQYEPDELVRVSGKIYCTRTHDSLKISNGKWFWWSRGIGGRSALDYLIKVRGMGFIEAVEHLCGKEKFVAPMPKYTSKPMPKSPFLLPERNTNNDRVVHYLTARGISPALIQTCIEKGTVYEERKYGNCCFVGYDYNGKAQYAMIRSSNPASTFMREAEGSNKEYSFRLSFLSGNDTVYVCESAIDLLSLATLRMRNGIDIRQEYYLSLSGVYQPREMIWETPLPAALARFLKENSNVRNISLRLDSDPAGQRAARTIQILLENSGYTVTYDPPKYGKDYNDMLMKKLGLSGVRTRQPNHAVREAVR
jgi:hypothetical protein